ncbi:hypothetical protein A2U01_0113638, partial [Trifolium medium]|nr:hypothetical protein [Trifolium medium]
MEMKPLEEVNVQPSPVGDVQSPYDVKVEASITTEVESSTNMEMEPSAEL